MAEKGFNLAIAIKDQLTPCIALGSQPDDPQPEDDIAEYLVRIENCSKNIQTTSLTADLPYGTTDPPLKLDTPYDQRKNSIENKTLRFGVASTMEEKYYPFSVKGSVILNLFNTWLYIKLRKTRVEIM